METNETTTLVIKEHDFQAAKNSLKKYAAKNSSELSLPSVPSSGGLFNLGDHKVTGDELNNVTSRIQGYFIDINKLTQGLIGEFGQVYKAFESLDKDYISGIVGSIKAAEKVSIDEQKDRAEIKKIVARLDKSVEVLKKFKEDIDKLKHITDVDKAWELISAQNKISDSLVAYKNELSNLKHLMDADDVWQEVETLKTGFPELGGKVSEIGMLIQGLNSTIGEIQAAITDQKNERQEFERRIDEKFAEHCGAVEQKICEQSNTINSHKDYLDSTIKNAHEALTQQFNSLSERQDKQIADIEKAQSEALADISEKQQSTLETIKNTQDEAAASMANTLEAEKVSLQETVVLLKQKLKTAYIVAGSAAAFALIHFVLNVVGVI